MSARVVTPQQVRREWIRQGGDPRAVGVMTNIFKRESGLNVRASNTGLNKDGTVDHGIAQINDIWRKDPVIGPLFKSGAIYTLKGGIKAAIRVLKVQGPRAWATFNEATDAKYLTGLKFGKGSDAAPPAIGATTGVITPGKATTPDTQDVKGAILDSFLNSSQRHGSLFQDLTKRIDSGEYLKPGSPAVPATTAPATIGGTIGSPKRAGSGKAIARSTPKSVIDFNIVPLARSLGINVTPESVTAANRRHGPTNTGGVSDHQGNGKDTWAGDFSNGSGPTKEMDKLAASIAKMYGIPWTGSGAVTHVAGGYRFQLIYRSNVGGNHFNHVHLGIKKV